MASSNNSTVASVPTSHKCDFGFAKKAPYGLLMTGQIIACLLIILVINFAPFKYEGTSVLISAAGSGLIAFGMILLGHLLGLQKRVFEMNNGFVLFVPLCFLYFVMNFIIFFLFVFNTMMCVISLLDSLRFTVGMIVSYGLLTVSFFSFTN